VKPDPDEGEKSDAGLPQDYRAQELRQYDETEAQWRLRRILDMTEEGLNDADIGEALGITQQSVRSIRAKHRSKELDEPLQSSLAMSLTNHAPDEANLERIMEIRHKADELCELIDRVTRDTPETAQAKVHLEETVMWAVKSLVLPRREGEGGKTFSREQRDALGIRGEERY
jgi:predicted transcriptional regulator